MKSTTQAITEPLFILNESFGAPVGRRRAVGWGYLSLICNGAIHSLRLSQTTAVLGTDHRPSGGTKCCQPTQKSSPPRQRRD